ncbi:hypothetical protein D3C78_1331070 [compost metagenome]
MGEHKYLLLQRIQPFEREKFTPFSGVKTRGVAFVTVDNLVQLTHPTYARIAHIPYQAKLAAGFENALYLGQRLRRGEPVEGLCADHGVH